MSLRSEDPLIPSVAGGWGMPSSRRGRTAIRAATVSAQIITRGRFQRSIAAPAKGPRNTWGSRAKRDAMAKAVADPVVSVIHQTRAN